MQKPLVRATVNGSSSGGREERESVIRIGGEENAFSTKTRHGVITVGTQWYVWEDEGLPAKLFVAAATSNDTR